MTVNNPKPGRARQGAKRPFVAFFGGAGTGGRRHMHAWVSRSTHGSRERMRAAPCGLDFSTPLAPRAQAEAAAAKDERIQAELLEIGQARPSLSPAGAINAHQRHVLP